MKMEATIWNFWSRLKAGRMYTHYLQRYRTDKWYAPAQRFDSTLKDAGRPVVAADTALKPNRKETESALLSSHSKYRSYMHTVADRNFRTAQVLRNFVTFASALIESVILGCHDIHFSQAGTGKILFYTRFHLLVSERNFFALVGNAMSHLLVSEKNACMQVSTSQISFATEQRFAEGADNNIKSRGHVEEKEASTRLKKLMEILNCSHDEMISLMAQYDFFRHLDLELVKEKAYLMLSFGLPYSFIKEHPRLLYQTSASELRKRLLKLQEESFLTDNPVISLDGLGHLLECKNEYFPYILKKLCRERDSLEGCNNQLEYLQFRLGCSEAEAQAMLSSYPLNRNISNTKVKKHLDFFLVEAKLSPQFVIAHKALFAFSLERLSSRWQFIQANNIKSEASMVYLWNMPQKKFENKFKTASDKSGLL